METASKTVNMTPIMRYQTSRKLPTHNLMTRWHSGCTFRIWLGIGYVSYIWIVVSINAINESSVLLAIRSHILSNCVADSVRVWPVYVPPIPAWWSDQMWCARCVLENGTAEEGRAAGKTRLWLLSCCRIQLKAATSTIYLSGVKIWWHDVTCALRDTKCL